ncbi:MetQ/NlpA family ABC transporter substrate-binding protein [Alicyclobacillus fastidiosus]|uniref:Lipoprotein n=1 Tax=Alicyclobacillus fastidiosus TaxID=392011 RepID=A0ABY6ZCC6_9BACL|nr:MetQ/NlpA family ABC transporter substrate-binding protein [Alicyclobacillus fastidiosus]WAH40390.1 MetQ/NlpA family ABC transporter substrate-binding protein [Alicyclobacillus fastidiosus]GMA61780.1 lipoprotein [Alicyclobacillus fastidiosus]
MKNIRQASVALATVTLGALFAVGCGTNSASNDGNGSSTASAKKDVVLKVAASPTPHAEILNDIKPILAKEGIQLEVIVYNDYIQPNRALSSGQVDANFFQHKPYLENYNEMNHTDLVPTVAVHFEPLGIYPGKSKSLANIPNGATIAVPDDTTNEARALLLLQNAGIIKLKDPNSISETKEDITWNPHHVNIEELDAAAIPRTVRDVNYAVINGNYALDAGYTVADALDVEKANSLAAKTYANYIVVRPDETNDWRIKDLDKAITSPQVKQFIETKFKGSVVPVF